MSIYKVYVVNFNGKEERMTAAKSKKAAAALMGISLSHLNKYGSETGNTADISTAICNIGTVFSTRIRSVLNPWDKEAEISLTGHHIDVMKHTSGLDHSKKPTRNHINVDPDSEDDLALADLVFKGYAVKVSKDPHIFPGNYYSLTEKGMEVVKGL